MLERLMNIRMETPERLHPSPVVLLRPAARGQALGDPYSAAWRSEPAVLRFGAKPLRAKVSSALL